MPGTENVKAEVKGDILTLTVDLSAPGHPSASRKTTVIGSTLGNKKAPGREEYIGLNVYRK